VASEPPKLSDLNALLEPGKQSELNKLLAALKRIVLAKPLDELTSPELAELSRVLEGLSRYELKQRDSPFYLHFYADAIFKRFVFLYRKPVFRILFPDWPEPAEALSTDYYTADGSEERMDCMCGTVTGAKAFVECDNSGRPESLIRYCGYVMNGVMRIWEDTGIIIEPLHAVIYTYKGDNEDVRRFQGIGTDTFAYKPRMVFLKDILDLRVEVEKAERLVDRNVDPFADECELVKGGLSVLGGCTGDRVELSIRLCTAGRWSWENCPGSRAFSLLMGVSSHLIPIDRILKLTEGLSNMGNFITDMDWATGGAFSRFYATDATRAAQEEARGAQEEAVRAKLSAAESENRALKAEQLAKDEAQAKAQAQAEIARLKDAMRAHGILKDD
jgi:hypothetical protein